MRRPVIVLPPREAFSPAAAGAIALVVNRLARAKGAGPAPTVIGPATGLAGFPEVDFRPVSPRPWPLLAQGRRYAGAVAAVLCRLAPALIEVHNRPDVALFLAARFTAIPVALFLHNDPRDMRAARSPAERQLLLGRLARVVSVSAFLRGLLLEGLEPSDRAVVLVNPIELPPPPPLPQGARDPVILFAGRMVKDKGADCFVEAAALALPELPGWRAEMFGADRFGPASPETRYLSLLRRRAEAAGVALHGYRPQTEVAQAMAKAAIVVVPSRWPEPFGLTALEAMAAGAALVAAPRGALAELAGAAARYAEPDNPPALAAAMIALARDLPARVRLGVAGRARAEAFAVPRVAAELAALRREILVS